MAEAKIEVKVVDVSGNVLKSLSDKLDAVGRSAGKASKDINQTSKSMFTLNTRTTDFIKGLVGFRVIESIFRRIGTEIRGVIKDMIDVNAETETFMATLETLTGSPEAAAKAFEELNQFARETPFQIKEIMEAFIKLKAGGLDPSIETMRILGDTASALGGSKETFDGIARALAQMVTKGKASAEELLQLQERGVPAMEILKEKLSLTAEEVANIGRQSIDAREAVAAILEGLEERFGGQMEKIAATWTGIIAELKSLWREFLEAVGEAGIFDALKNRLSELRGSIREAFKTGEAQKFAEDLSSNLQTIFKAIVIVSEVVIELAKLFKAMVSPIDAMRGGVDDLNNSIGNISKAFKDMVDFSLRKLDEFTEDARNSLRQLASDAFKSGQALVTSFADGIKAAASAAVSAVRSLVARLKSFLPESPAEEGPLSDLDKVGPAFVKTIADGIDNSSDVLFSSVRRLTQGTRSLIDRLDFEGFLARSPLRKKIDLEMGGFHATSITGRSLQNMGAASTSNVMNVSFNVSNEFQGGAASQHFEDIDRRLAEAWRSKRSQLRRAMAQ